MTAQQYHPAAFPLQVNSSEFGSMEGETLGQLGLPRLGELAACFPPRSLKKPRPNEARTFLLPKLPSLVFPLEEEELAPALVLP